MSKPQDNSATTNKPDSPAIPTKYIIKDSTCLTLSGNGTIGYEIRVDNKKAVHIRITSNSGDGFFSNKSISMTDIESTLFSQPDPSRLTSVALQSLFKGKSVNTPCIFNGSPSQ